MAAPGYHKGLRSTNQRLEVKRAGKPWDCCGVTFELDVSPNDLQDMWAFGRAPRCAKQIKQGDLYLANGLLPAPMMAMLHSNPRTAWVDWPTCVMCGIEFYSEFLDGPVKIENLVPLTPEQIEEMRSGLYEILSDMRATSVALRSGTEEPSSPRI